MAKNNSDRKYYQIILDWFQEQLATGALKKGDRLPSERELAQRLQVSRVPVREAMLILEHTGIIASSPKGSFVVCSSGRDTHRRELINYTNVEAVDILHQVANFYVGTKQSHDYGTGEVYTSVEVHLIKYIADHPGVTVTALAMAHGKTKSAISQKLKKLENAGLFRREISPENERVHHLYITEKGLVLDRNHREYDDIHFEDTMAFIREQFSSEEISIAFQLLERWIEVRRQVQERRRLEEEKQKRLKKNTTS